VNVVLARRGEISLSLLWESKEKEFIVEEFIEESLFALSSATGGTLKSYPSYFEVLGSGSYSK